VTDNNKTLFQFPVRIIRFICRNLKSFIYKTSIKIPYFHFIKNTAMNGNACTFKLWFFQKILGFNCGAYWPVDHRSKVNQWKNICLGVDVAPGIEPGCYIQGIGEVYIGDYTRIAQNVGILSANHKAEDLRIYEKGKVVIGKYCWIGMNAVILPGVVLGDFTIVGAGSVVTKSFEDGYCVIGGSPARKIKELEQGKCLRYTNDNLYNGYISADNFEEFKAKNLWIECRKNQANK
jgi:acetyltransferase-like isoleucine patch superfamily enzyme